MILSRAPLIEEPDSQFWFDYSACKFPVGLDLNEIFYFNEENISEVLLKDILMRVRKNSENFIIFG